MSIIDGQRNQKGVQRFGTEWAGTLAAGDGCLVYHTNGTVYSIFAVNFLNTVIQRRLFMSWSTDGGVTWTAPVQLTTGNFDDEPTAIQLDTTSTSSLIGVVYNSATTPFASGTVSKVLHRFTVDTSGVVQTPFDSLSVSGEFLSPNLVKIAAGFAVFMRDLGPNPGVSVTTNSIFTNNSWTTATAAGPGNFFGASTNSILDLSVTRMANGHLCLVGCVRTALDGSASVGSLGQNINGTVRADVMTSFSSDDGSTWSTPQNLTSYSGTPKLDMIGIATAITAQGFDLSDGTVVIGFQEGIASQVINTSTTLALPASPGFMQTALYHATHNMLILCCDSTFGGDGGILIYDLTNQTRTRLFTSSTPALWVNKCQDIALSFDDKYLAVASNGSLDIIDTTDPSPANWTVNGIRDTSIPASKGTNMARAKFEATGYNLFIAYGGAPAAGGGWGFKIDASNTAGGITDLQYSAVGFTAILNYWLRNNGSIIIAYNANIESVSQSSGLSQYSTTLTGYSMIDLLYDSITGETIAALSFSGPGVSDTGIARIHDSGSVFSVGTFFTTPSSTHTSNPATMGWVGGWSQYYPGIGVMLSSSGSGSNTRREFYSFTEQTLYGPVNVQNWTDGNELFVNDPGRRFPDIQKGGQWAIQMGSSVVSLNQMKKRGRIRWAIYPYNASTKQLTTAGVDFFDLLNIVRLDPTSPLSIKRFALARDNTDLIYGFYSRWDFSRTTQIMTALNGTVEPDAFKLFARARILKHESNNLQSKARIRQTYNQTLEMKSRIVFAQCVMMKARIVPITTVDLQMRANIKASKQSTLLVQYDVAAARQAHMRLSFTAQTGYNTVQTLGMGARVASVQRQRFTGYFLVSGQQLVTNIGFSNTGGAQQTTTMRAFIRA